MQIYYNVIEVRVILRKPVVLTVQFSPPEYSNSSNCIQFWETTTYIVFKLLKLLLNLACLSCKFIPVCLTLDFDLILVSFSGVLLSTSTCRGLEGLVQQRAICIFGQNEILKSKWSSRDQEPIGNNGFYSKLCYSWVSPKTDMAIFFKLQYVSATNLNFKIYQNCQTCG